MKMFPRSQQELLSSILNVAKLFLLVVTAIHVLQPHLIRWSGISQWFILAYAAAILLLIFGGSRQLSMGWKEDARQTAVCIVLGTSYLFAVLPSIFVCS